MESDLHCPIPLSKVSAKNSKVFETTGMVIAFQHDPLVMMIGTYFDEMCDGLRFCISTADPKCLE